MAQKENQIKNIILFTRGVVLQYGILYPVLFLIASWLGIWVFSGFGLFLYNQHSTLSHSYVFLDIFVVIVYLTKFILWVIRKNN